MGTFTVASNGHSYSGADQYPTKGERCEGYDNNCNGTINDGCPKDYSFSNYRMQGSPAGYLAANFTDSFCTSGQVLIGLTVNAVDQVGTCQINGGVWGVIAQCANPRITEDDQNAPFSYVNARGTIVSHTLVGGQSPYLGPLCDHLRTSKHVRCDGLGRAITGLRGKSGSRIDSLSIRCKEKAFSDPTLVNPTTVTMNNLWESSYYPPTFSGGAAFENDCANNEVAVGIRSHYLSGRLSSIELRCADIATNNQ